MIPAGQEGFDAGDGDIYFCTRPRSMLGTLVTICAASELLVRLHLCHHVVAGIFRDGWKVASLASSNQEVGGWIPSALCYSKVPCVRCKIPIFGFA